MWEGGQNLSILQDLEEIHFAGDKGQLPWRTNASIGQQGRPELSREHIQAQVPRSRVNMMGNSALQHHLAIAETHSSGGSTSEVPAMFKESAKGVFTVCISSLEQA